MEKELYKTNEDLKELQEITFKILMYLKGICKELGLRYFLAYGTLIGAIRHKGFVPWDDDIDVWMPREDFMILLDYLCKNEDERYTVSTGKYKIKGEWPEKLQIKILDKYVEVERMWEKKGQFISSHPWIDVFALDNAPDKHENYIKKFRKKRVWYQLCRSKYFNTDLNNIKGTINRTVYFMYNKMHLLRHVLNYDKAGERLFDAVTSYRNDPSGKQYFCNAAVYIHKIDKCFFDKEWFSDSVEVQYGEGTFSVPSGYDAILTKIYGDYMTPPPPEARTGGHFGKILSRKY